MNCLRKIQKYKNRSRAVLNFFFLVLASVLLISKSFAEERPSQLIIDDIVCNGNDATNCQFITNKFFQKVGDILDPEEVSDARFRLGSLELFRDVTIHLEKGKKRHHVIVVINVKEANTKQHQLTIRANHAFTERRQCEFFECINSDANTTELLGSYSFTEYNFLGTNKQLGVGIQGGYFDQFIDSNNGDFDSSLFLSNGSFASFVLTYTDPHLFDSKKYFANAYYDYSRSDVDYNDSFFDRSGRDTDVGFSVGRRFGRFSYFSLGFNHDETAGLETSFTYGWDSRNSAIFATEGSTFRFSINGDRGGDFLGYTRYHQLADKHLLSWGVGLNRDNAQDQSLGHIKYTYITEQNDNTGKYSSWSTYFSSSGYGDHQSTLGLTYSKHTNDFILNLGLSVSEGGN